MEDDPTPKQVVVRFQILLLLLSNLYLAYLSKTQRFFLKSLGWKEARLEYIGSRSDTSRELN